MSARIETRIRPGKGDVLLFSLPCGVLIGEGGHARAKNSIFDYRDANALRGKLKIECGEFRNYLRGRELIVAWEDDKENEATKANSDQRGGAKQDIGGIRFGIHFTQCLVFLRGGQVATMSRSAAL